MSALPVAVPQTFPATGSAGVLAGILARQAWGTSHDRGVVKISVFLVGEACFHLRDAATLPRSVTSFLLPPCASVLAVPNDRRLATAPTCAGPSVGVGGTDFGTGVSSAVRHMMPRIRDSFLLRSVSRWFIRHCPMKPRPTAVDPKRLSRSGVFLTRTRSRSRSRSRIERASIEPPCKEFRSSAGVPIAGS